MPENRFPCSNGGGRDLVSIEGGQGVVERETVLRNAILEYYRKLAQTCNNDKLKKLLVKVL